MKRYSQRRGVMPNHPSKKDIEKTRIKNARSELRYEQHVQQRLQADEDNRKITLVAVGLFVTGFVVYNMWTFIGG